MGLLDILSGVGNVVDTYTGAGTVRDLLAGEPAFDQLLDPLNESKRVSGREMLRKNPLTSQLLSSEDTLGNAIGGFAAEMLLDPTNWLGGVSALLKARGLAKAARGRSFWKGLRGSQAQAMGVEVPDYAKRLFPNFVDSEIKDTLFGPRDIAARNLMYEQALRSAGPLDRLKLLIMREEGKLDQLAKPLRNQYSMSAPFGFYQYPQEARPRASGFVTPLRNDIAFIASNPKARHARMSEVLSHEAAHTWQYQHPKEAALMRKLMNKDVLRASGADYFQGPSMYDAALREGDIFGIDVPMADMEAMANYTGRTVESGLDEAIADRRNPIVSALVGNMSREDAADELARHSAYAMQRQLSRFYKDPEKYFNLPAVDKYYFSQFIDYLSGKKAPPKSLSSGKFATTGGSRLPMEVFSSNPVNEPVDWKQMTPDILAALGYNTAQSAMRGLEYK